MRAALALRLTLDLAVLYAITFGGFGGFVAFGAYLPTYLQETYALATPDAAARAGGFIVLAVLARPVGGMLSDGYGAPRVLAVGFGVVAVGALLLALPLSLLVAAGVFLTIAVALGLGSGTVFALVGRRAPAASVGAVTGFVGAAGGLGGFVPPLVMGAMFQTTGSFVIGWLLLALVAAGGHVHTRRRFLAAGSRPSPNRPTPSVCAGADDAPRRPTQRGYPEGTATIGAPWLVRTWARFRQAQMRTAPPSLTDGMRSSGVAVVNPLSTPPVDAPANTPRGFSLSIRVNRTKDAPAKAGGVEAKVPNLGFQRGLAGGARGGT